MKRIGLLGVGTLGTIFAERLIGSGLELSLFDRDRSRLDPFDGRATVLTDPVALGQGEALVVSLPDPDASRAALTPVLAAARPGLLVLDTSTIDRTTACEHSRTAAGRQIAYVEAPLSGGDEEGSGVDAARAGAITFICGGSTGDVAALRPLMMILGRHVVHVGPAGSGSVAKLVSNHLAGLHNLVAAEAFAVGRAAGLDLETILRVLEHTDGKSFWIFSYLAPRLEASRFDDGFAVDLQHKDHRLFGELADAVGVVPTPFNDLALASYAALQARGLGRADLTIAAAIAMGDVA